MTNRSRRLLFALVIASQLIPSFLDMGIWPFLPLDMLARKQKKEDIRVLRMAVKIDGGELKYLEGKTGTYYSTEIRRNLDTPKKLKEIAARKLINTPSVSDDTETVFVVERSIAEDGGIQSKIVLAIQMRGNS